MHGQQVRERGQFGRGERGHVHEGEDPAAGAVSPVSLRKVMSNYDANHDNVLEPADMAKVMIDTYRGMNRHFIPTGYELSTYAR